MDVGLGVAFQSLRKALEQKPSFTSGTVALPAESTKIFFQSGEVFGGIDLAKPTSEQLDLLVKACQPATFGRNQEDVLDESYRKAGKLDASNFAINLDLTALGLIERINQCLLVDNRPIRGELYKLNVYGPGSFFKPHKDTPRADNMFGSLVLVLPTPHEGGELVLRVGAKETRYDSSAILAKQEKPSIGYVAFYGDIEHEVLPVTSGHRITLTYNLFFGNQSQSPIGPPPGLEHPLATALKDVLNSPDFFPQGCWLGYGLKYQYPVSGNKSLDRVVGNLKGEDAVVARVFAALKLRAVIKVIYKTEYNFEGNRYVALNAVPDVGSGDCQYERGELFRELMGAKGALEVCWQGSGSGSGRGEDDGDDESDSEPMEITWFTEPRFGGTKLSYMAYGNEATLEFAYGSFCFLAHVESYEARQAALAAE